jgi:hypothetical protein
MVGLKGTLRGGMLSRTIKVGTITLTLGLNKGANRYEGFSENSRVLIRQEPWGAWSACIVKRHEKGAMISAHGDYDSPEKAGQALIEETIKFNKTMDEFIGEHEMPKV